jgi:hypothetical protein
VNLITRRLLRDHGGPAALRRGTAEQGNGPPRDYSGVSFLSRCHLRGLSRLARPARCAWQCVRHGDDGHLGSRQPRSRVCRAAPREQRTLTCCCRALSTPGERSLASEGRRSHLTSPATRSICPARKDPNRCPATYLDDAGSDTSGLPSLMKPEPWILCPVTITVRRVANVACSWSSSSGWR